MTNSIHAVEFSVYPEAAPNCFASDCATGDSLIWEGRNSIDEIVEAFEAQQEWYNEDVLEIEFILFVEYDTPVFELCYEDQMAIIEAVREIVTG